MFAKMSMYFRIYTVLETPAGAPTLLLSEPTYLTLSTRLPLHEKKVSFWLHKVSFILFSLTLTLY